MDINNRIKEQLETNPVLLYMKGTPDFPQCGFSGQTVAALKAGSADRLHTSISLKIRKSERGLKTYSNWPTFPQLYIDGELVGGADIVVDMFHSGELKEMLVSDESASSSP